MNEFEKNLENSLAYLCSEINIEHKGYYALIDKLVSLLECECECVDYKHFRVLAFERSTVSTHIGYNTLGKGFSMEEILDKTCELDSLIDNGLSSLNKHFVSLGVCGSLIDLS